MIQAAKEAFKNNMHHHNMKTIARAYLRDQGSLVPETVFHILS